MVLACIGREVTQLWWSQQSSWIHRQTVRFSDIGHNSPGLGGDMSLLLQKVLVLGCPWGAAAGQAKENPLWSLHKRDLGLLSSHVQLQGCFPLKPGVTKLYVNACSMRCDKEPVQLSAEHTPFCQPPQRSSTHVQPRIAFLTIHLCTGPGEGWLSILPN